ncbi:hypothetical protein DY000_02015762 [Brassica cretica]|uniref:Retrotransposon gag domain-containing protein n=1 Tax=Brassica cretica TaxID=69181 RepID=A0ABQ7D7N3_BRACR|nr:hypothetical protein DY000_02015762 [Brassica cretica]
MKRRFLGSSKKEPADSRTIRCWIPDVIVVAEMNDFDMRREWYDWVGQDTFQGLPHQGPRNHIEELEDLVSSWFSQLQPGSLTRWEDIERAFLFLDDAEVTREKEKNDKWDRAEQSRRADKSDPTSVSIDSSTLESINIDTSETINTSTATPIDSTTSTSTNVTTSTSIDGTTSESIPTQSHHRSTETHDGDREVTMEDFLELEEWLEDMDQNSKKKKLDDDQHTSRGDLETSPKASIDRHQPDGIDRQPPHIIDQRPPYIID